MLACSDIIFVGHAGLTHRLAYKLLLPELNKYGDDLHCSRTQNQFQIEIEIENQNSIENDDAQKGIKRALLLVGFQSIITVSLLRIVKYNTAKDRTA